MFKKLFAPLFYINNWWIYYLDFFKLISPKLIEFKLRNKIRLFAVAGTFDSRIINEIWGEKVYKLEELDKDTIKTVIDIGAHKGYFSILAATMTKASQIVAIEPLESNYKILTKNASVNKMKKIKTYNLGISNKSESRELFASKTNSGGFSMIKDWFASEKEIISIKMKCVTLESILKKEKITNIDLLKIDVEGAEYVILQSFSSETFKKIKNIVMEFHQVGTLRVKDIIKLLKKYNFVVETTPTDQTIGMLYAKKRKA